MDNSNRKNAISTRRLAMNAIFIAIYVVLGSFAINIGTSIRLTFVGFPRLISVLLFGTVDGVFVAGIGEFLYQMMSYGFDATTLLWLVPPIVHALVAGLCVRGFKKDLNLKRMAIVILAAGLATSLITIPVMYLSGMIKGYNPGLTWISTLFRFVNTLIMSAIYTLIVPKTVELLKRVYRPKSA